MKEQLIKSIDLIGYIIQTGDTKGELQIQLGELSDLLLKMKDTDDNDKLLELHQQSIDYLNTSIVNNFLKIISK